MRIKNKKANSRFNFVTKLTKLPKSKRSIEMSFNWIFSFIAGGIILLLAIYGVSRIMQTSENLFNTESAAEINILLDSLETGSASLKSPSEINFNKEVKTFYTCSFLDNKPFGKQTIAFAEKNLKNQFSQKGEEITIKNKYIFSEESVEGKSMHIFSKPFFMPFKILDSIIIFSKEYCFYQPPNEIEREIESLNIKQIKIIKDLKNCTGIKVCFESERPECNIKVFGAAENYKYGKVSKNNKQIYYNGGLIYGAIFSSPDIYECNIKRLAGRLDELARIYLDKADIMQKKGCGSAIKGDLNELMNSARAVNSSEDSIFLLDISNKIDSINTALIQGCKLY